MYSGHKSNELLKQVEELVRKLGLKIDIDQSGYAELESLLQALHLKQTELEHQNDVIRREHFMLEAEKMEYQELFENAPMGYLVLDDKGFIIQANHHFCGLLGKGKPDLINTNLKDILEQGSHNVFESYLQKVIAQHEPNAEELTMFASQGKKMVVKLECQPFYPTHNHQVLIKCSVIDVSSFKENENQLLRLNTAFEQSANSILITDTDGNIEYANPRFFQVTGYTPQEVIGKNPRFLKYEKSTIDYKKMWETISSGETWSGEFLNRSKSGELYWEIGTITPVKNNLGEIINYLAIKEDITQRKAAEVKLMQAKDFYLNLLEDFPVMVWQCDKNGELNFLNKTFLTFTGWKHTEQTISAYLELIHPRDQAVFKDAFQNSLDTISPFIVEYRIIDRYQNYRWVLNHGKPFNDIDGNYGGFIASCIDIHDRMLVEQRLMESENKYRRMFEDSSMGIFRLDRKFNFTFANKSFATVFGHENVVDFLIEINTNPLLYFPDFLKEKGFLKEIVRNPKERFVIERELINKQGETIYTVIHLRKINDRGPEGDYYIEGFMEDVTQKKIAEENLLRSEQKFKALFDKSYDAILILDALEIADSNLKASELFQIPADMLLGMNFLELCPLNSQEDASREEFIRAKVNRALHGHSATFDLPLLRGYAQFDAEISLARIYVNNKAMVQLIIRDVSEKRQAEKQIKQASDEAERARRAQSDFLSLMSHEIRTPLNAVVSLTDLLLQDKLTADQMENLNSVKISARHLLGLIDDILDFNKIESGNIQFEKYDFDLRSLVLELRKPLEVKAKEKDIRLIMEVDEDIPAVVRADTLRLKQILFNLLSNALKFTEKGLVRLRVKRKNTNRHENLITFEVHDTGIGIAEDRLAAIFEKFTQAETSTSRKYGGSGLGLAICKRLVELQGGEITAISTPGQGSTFTFFLPMEEGVLAESTPSAVPAAMSADSLEGMHILLVEDDKMNQFVAQKIIQKKWKAELSIASTGEEALQMLVEEDYELVLMDLLLPGIDGYQVTRQIRKNEDHSIKNQFVPIIALTADAFMETRAKAYEAGVDDFVSKPFDYIKLFEKISRFRGR